MREATFFGQVTVLCTGNTSSPVVYGERGVQSLSELPQLPDVAKPATRFYLLRINRLCIMDSAQEYFRSNWKNGGILAGGVSVREAS